MISLASFCTWGISNDTIGYNGHIQPNRLLDHLWISWDIKDMSHHLKKFMHWWNKIDSNIPYSSLTLHVFWLLVIHCFIPLLICLGCVNCCIDALTSICISAHVIQTGPTIKSTTYILTLCYWTVYQYNSGKSDN